MAVEYFAHDEHPLILVKEYPINRWWCVVCGRHVREQEYYRCSHRGFGCDDYYLHKSCSEIPTKIQHPVHPDHPLTLLPFNITHNCTNGCCNYCEVFKYCFTYHCSLCQFNLCVSCALPIVLNIDYASHQHQPLITLRMEASLFCEACGTEHRGIFYTCPTCISNSHSQFFIHMDCASLPQTFQYSGHDDHGDGDLILGYSIPPEYTLHNQYCKICSERVNPKYWVYYCGGCRYFVHINCAYTTSSSDKAKNNNISEETTQP